MMNAPCAAWATPKRFDGSPDNRENQSLGACRIQVIAASMMGEYEQMVTVTRRIVDLCNGKSGTFGPLSHQRSRLILSPTGSYCACLFLPC